MSPYETVFTLLSFIRTMISQYKELVMNQSVKNCACCTIFFQLETLLFGETAFTVKIIRQMIQSGLYLPKRWRSPRTFKSRSHGYHNPKKRSPATQNCQVFRVFRLLTLETSNTVQGSKMGPIFLGSNLMQMLLGDFFLISFPLFHSA